MASETTASSVHVRVEGRPAPKGSRTQGKTKTGRMYTFPASKHEKPWVDAVTAATALQMRHRDPLPPPYKLKLEILVHKGRHTSKPWPSQHDLDKLARAVVDGLVKGRAMTDDRDVIEICATKRYAELDEAPGVIATVGSAEP